MTNNDLILQIGGEIDNYLSESLINATQKIAGNNTLQVQASPNYQQLKPLNRYDAGITYGSEQDKLRASNQPFIDELAIGVSNGIQNAFVSTVENFNLIPTLFTSDRESREWSEKIDNFYKQYKNYAGEIYTEGDDRAWWLNQVSNLIDSGGSFAITGLLTGGTLGLVSKLGKAKDIAGFLNFLNKGNSIEQGLATTGQVLRQGVTTYALSATEGQLVGMESAKNIKNKYENDALFRSKIDNDAKKKGISSEEYLKRVQDTAFSTSANIATAIGVPLNITGISSIFSKPTAVKTFINKSAGLSLFDDTAKIASELGTIKKPSLMGNLKGNLGEMGQEALEEGLQSIAGKIGEERGISGKDKISGINVYGEAFNDAINIGSKLFDKEFFVSSMLGALGGGLQKGAIDLFTSKSRSKQYEKDLADFVVLKNDFIRNAQQAQDKTVKLRSLINGIKNEQEYVQNKPVIQDLKEDLFQITAREALRRGNVDVLENDLKKIYEIDGDKTEKDLAKEELNKFIQESGIDQKQLDEILQKDLMAKQYRDSYEMVGIDKENTLTEEEQAIADTYKEKLNKVQEASDFSIKEVMGLEDNYKTIAQQKIAEIKELSERWLVTEAFRNPKNEFERLNTLDYFLASNKKAKIQQRMKDAALSPEALQEEISQLLSTDAEYMQDVFDISNLNTELDKLDKDISSIIDLSEGRTPEQATQDSDLLNKKKSKKAEIEAKKKEKEERRKSKEYTAEQKRLQERLDEVNKELKEIENRKVPVSEIKEVNKKLSTKSPETIEEKQQVVNDYNEKIVNGEELNKVEIEEKKRLEKELNEIETNEALQKVIAFNNARIDTTNTLKPTFITVSELRTILKNDRAKQQLATVFDVEMLEAFINMLGNDNLVLQHRTNGEVSVYDGEIQFNIEERYQQLGNKTNTDYANSIVGKDNNEKPILLLDKLKAATTEEAKNKIIYDYFVSNNLLNKVKDNPLHHYLINEDTAHLGKKVIKLNEGDRIGIVSNGRIGFKSLSKIEGTLITLPTIGLTALPVSKTYIYQDNNYFPFFINKDNSIFFELNGDLRTDIPISDVIDHLNTLIEDKVDGVSNVDTKKLLERYKQLADAGTVNTIKVSIVDDLILEKKPREGTFVPIGAIDNFAKRPENTVYIDIKALLSLSGATGQYTPFSMQRIVTHEILHPMIKPAMQKKENQDKIKGLFKGISDGLANLQATRIQYNKDTNKVQYYVFNINGVEYKIWINLYDNITKGKSDAYDESQAVDEFIVELLSNYEFRQILKAIPYSGEITMFDRLIQIISEILGMNKPNYLAKSLATVDDILNPNKNEKRETLFKKEVNPFDSAVSNQKPAFDPFPDKLSDIKERRQELKNYKTKPLFSKIEGNYITLLTSLDSQSSDNNGALTQLIDTIVNLKPNQSIITSPINRMAESYRSWWLVSNVANRYKDKEKVKQLLKDNLKEDIADILIKALDNNKSPYELITEYDANLVKLENEKLIVKEKPKTIVTANPARKVEAQGTTYTLESKDAVNKVLSDNPEIIAIRNNYPNIVTAFEVLKAGEGSGIVNPKLNKDEWDNFVTEIMPLIPEIAYIPFDNARVYELDEEGKPLKDEDGNFIEKPNMIQLYLTYLEDDGRDMITYIKDKNEKINRLDPSKPIKVTLLSSENTTKIDFYENIFGKNNNQKQIEEKWTYKSGMLKSSSTDFITNTWKNGDIIIWTQEGKTKIGRYDKNRNIIIDNISNLPNGLFALITTPNSEQVFNRSRYDEDIKNLKSSNNVKNRVFKVTGKDFQGNDITYYERVFLPNEYELDEDVEISDANLTIGNIVKSNQEISFQQFEDRYKESKGSSEGLEIFIATEDNKAIKGISTNGRENVVSTQKGKAYTVVDGSLLLIQEPLLNDIEKARAKELILAINKAKNKDGERVKNNIKELEKLLFMSEDGYDRFSSKDGKITYKDINKVEQEITESNIDSLLENKRLNVTKENVNTIKDRLRVFADNSKYNVVGKYVVADLPIIEETGKTQETNDANSIFRKKAPIKLDSTPTVESSFSEAVAQQSPIIPTEEVEQVSSIKVPKKRKKGSFIDDNRVSNSALDSDTINESPFTNENKEDFIRSLHTRIMKALMDTEIGLDAFINLKKIQNTELNIEKLVTVGVEQLFNLYLEISEKPNLTNAQKIALQKQEVFYEALDDEDETFKHLPEITRVYKEWLNKELGLQLSKDDDTLKEEDVTSKNQADDTVSQEKDIEESMSSITKVLISSLPKLDKDGNFILNSLGLPYSQSLSEVKNELGQILSNVSSDEIIGKLGKEPKYIDLYQILITESDLDLEGNDLVRRAFIKDFHKRYLNHHKVVVQEKFEGKEIVPVVNLQNATDAYAKEKVGAKWRNSVTENFIPYETNDEIRNARSPQNLNLPASVGDITEKLGYALKQDGVIIIKDGKKVIDVDALYNTTEMGSIFLAMSTTDEEFKFNQSAGLSGKTYYNITQTTFANEVIDALNTRDIERFKHLSSEWSSNSEFIDKVRKEQKGVFKLIPLNGVELKSVGEETKKLTQYGKIMMDMLTTADNKLTMLPTHSDKSTNYLSNYVEYIPFSSDEDILIEELHSFITKKGYLTPAMTMDNGGIVIDKNGKKRYKYPTKKELKSLMNKFKKDLANNAVTSKNISKKDVNVAHFFVNKYIHNIEMFKVFYGNPASLNQAEKRVAYTFSTKDFMQYDMYLENYFGKLDPKLNNIRNREDRKYHGTITKDLMNNEKVLIIDNPDLTGSILDTNVKNLEESINELEKLYPANTDKGKRIREQRKEVIESYKKTDPSDGQAIISLDLWREAIYRTGRWNPMLNNIYWKVRNNELLDTEELSYVINTQKLMYSAIDENGNGVYHKASWMPLIPQLIGSKAGDIRKAMIRDQIGYIIYASGRKDKKPTVGTMDDVISGNYKKENTVIIDVRNLGIQSEVANKVKNQVTDSSQMRVLLFLNKDDNEEVRKEYERYVSLYEQLNELSSIEILEELGLNANNELVDKDKLMSFLKDNVTERDDINYIEALEIGDNLNVLPNVLKIMQTILAHIDKKTRSHKVNGEGYIQASSLGFADDLLFYRIKNGKVLPAQIAVPVPKEMLKIVEERGGLEKFNNLLEVIHTKRDNGEPLREDEKNILDMTTYVSNRIPGQDINSLEYLEVKRFLNPVMGLTAFVPYEITTKVGSDFDVDKLNTYRPYINKSGKIYQEEISEAQLKDEFDLLKVKLAELEDKAIEKLKKIDTDDLANDPASFKLIQDIFGDNEITDEDIAEEIKLSGQKDYYKYLQNMTYEKYEERYIRRRKATLVNQIQDIMKNRLSDPYNFEYLISPNDAKQLKDLAKEIDPNGGKTIKTVFDLFDPNKQMELFIANNAGKQLVGIEAVWNVSHQKFQITKPEIDLIDGKWIINDPNSLIVDENGGIDESQAKQYNIEIPKEFGLGNKIVLGKETSQNGDIISKLFSQQIDGTVDIAKDSWITRLGVNLKTANWINFLLASGVNKEIVFEIATQKAIKIYDQIRDINESWYFKTKRLRKGMINNDHIPYLTMLAMEEGNSVIGEINKYLALKEKVKKGNPDLDNNKRNKIIESELIAQSKFNPDEKFDFTLVDTKNQKALAYWYHNSAIPLGKIASAITKQMNYDSKTLPNNVTELYQKEMELKMLKSVFPQIQDLIDNTLIRPFHKAYKNAMEMVQDMSILNNQVFNTLFIRKMSGMEFRVYGDNKDKLLNDMKNDIILYQFQNSVINYKGQEVKVIDIMDNLQSKDGIVKVIKELKENSLTKDLKIVQELFEYTKDKLDKKTKTFTEGLIKFHSRQLTVNEFNNVVDSFKRLMAVNKDAAIDLAIVTILQSGINRTQLSYTDKVPASLYKELMGNVIKKPEIDEIKDFLSKVYEQNVITEEKGKGTKRINYKKRFVKSNVIDNTEPEINDETAEPNFTEPMKDYATEKSKKQPKICSGK